MLSPLRDGCSISGLPREQRRVQVQDGRGVLYRDGGPFPHRPRHPRPGWPRGPCRRVDDGACCAPLSSVAGVPPPPPPPPSLRWPGAGGRSEAYDALTFAGWGDHPPPSDDEVQPTLDLLYFSENGTRAERKEARESASRPEEEEEEEVRMVVGPLAGFWRRSSPRDPPPASPLGRRRSSPDTTRTYR